MSLAEDTRVFVQYDLPGPELWHERLVLAACACGRGWHIILTPDLDMYPEHISLENTDLAGFRVATGEGFPFGITAQNSSGKQRLVVDARLTNCWFGDPEGVRLATGSSFSQLEVDGGPPVSLGAVDIADAFYQIQLPSELRDLFGLLPVKARLVGIDRTVEGIVDPDSVVVPVFRAVPMGWTQALWLCQYCHESIVDGIPGLGGHNRLVDRSVPPPLHPLLHTEYVDNFVCLSQDGKTARERAEQVQAALQSRGLPTHEVEASIGGETLGWEFSDVEPGVHLSRRRLWKYRLGIQELLKIGYCSSRTLERIVGHLTFAGLVRREFLSVFQAVYVFIRKGFGEKTPLWPAVRRELHWASSLLPLLHRDFGMSWSNEVFATDASLWGRGVTSAVREVEAIRSLGQINERWRFSATEEWEANRGSASPGNDPLNAVSEVPVDFIGSDWRQVDGAKWGQNRGHSGFGRKGSCLVGATSCQITAAA